MSPSRTTVVLPGASPLPDDTPEAAPGLLASFWRYRRSSLALVLAGALAGVAMSFLVPRLQDSGPTAVTRIALTDPRGDTLFRLQGSSPGEAERNAAERRAVINSTRVLSRAAEILGTGWTVEQLERSVVVTGGGAENVFVVKVTAETDAQAREAADAVVRAYQDVTRADIRAEAETALESVSESRERLQAQLAATTDGQQRSAMAQALGQLETRANEILVTAALFDGGVNFVDRAAITDPTSDPDPVRFGLAGALLGFLLAMVVSWVRADRAVSADSAEMPVDILGAPLLGEVPSAGAIRMTSLRELPGEPFGFATAALRSVLPAGLVLVTSPEKRDGRSGVAAGLAVAAAREGRRVALVDADTTGSGLVGLADFPKERPGLADIAGVNGQRTEVGPTVVSLGGASSLDAVGAGKSRPDLGARYGSDEVGRFLRELRHTHDLVIVDCPPLADGAAAAALTRHADGVLLVVQRGTRLVTLEAARRRLEPFRTRILGYVFATR